MDHFKVTIIDDYEDALDLLDYNLYKNGYHTKSFNDSVQAIKYINSNNTQLVVTDWLMPTMTGLEVVEKLRSNKNTKDIPIIMVTCKSSEEDIVKALKSGVDDYLVKPFKMNEFLARVEKISKKHHESHSNTITLGPLLIDSPKYSIRLENKLLTLTYSEFKLIELFAKHPAKVFSRYEIINCVSGSESISTERAVDVLIAGTRKKLGRHKNLIETVRSVGYRIAQV